MLSSGDYYQPTVYSYYLGWSTSTEYNSNNNFFTSFDFNNSTHTPITGYEHMTIKLVRSYINSVKNNSFFKGLDTNALAEGGFMLGIMLSGVAFAAEGLSLQLGMTLLKIGGATFNPYILALAVVLIVISFFITTSKDFIEDCKQLLKRYTTTNYPYIKTGATIYKDTNTTTIDNGKYFCDGGYFYNVPSPGSTVTTKTLSYKYIGGVKTYSKDVLDINNTQQSYTLINDEILDLLFLSYIAGKPEKFDTAQSLFVSETTSTLVSQSSDIIGSLNNPIDINYQLPEGFITSFDPNDITTEITQTILSDLTGLTHQYLYSFEEKPGVVEIQTYFTHEIKIEDNPNIFILNYDNSSDNGVTIGTTLYYEYDGDSSVLDGYYAISGSTPYRTFYKTTNGNVVDIITMETSVSTTGSSVNSGPHNVISNSKDYTSGWFLNSHLTKDLDLNVYNNTNNLIIDWNTSNFYNSEYVTRGLIKDFTTKDSLVLYGDNTTSTEIDNSTTDAEQQFYRQIFPFDSEVFVYDREDTLTIKPVEVCNTGGPNGINYQILDSNGNLIPSYVGVEFNSNIYTGSSILYSSTTVTILGSEYEKYVDLPNINSGDITDVTISITSSNSLWYDAMSELYFSKHARANHP